MSRPILQSVDQLITHAAKSLKFITEPLTEYETSALRGVVLGSCAFTIAIISIVSFGGWKSLTYFICTLWFMCILYYSYCDEASRLRIDTVIIRLYLVFKQSISYVVSSIFNIFAPQNTNMPTSAQPTEAAAATTSSPPPSHQTTTTKEETLKESKNLSNKQLSYLFTSPTSLSRNVSRN